MNRIEFFKQFFVGGASWLLARQVSFTTKEAKEIYLNSPHIAGLQYYNGPELEEQLQENDNLILHRDAQNPHDFFAVEVFRNKQKLGFLPRTDNKIVARMMDQGVMVKAKIRHIDPDAHPFRRVKIRVYSEMG